MDDRLSTSACLLILAAGIVSFLAGPVLYLFPSDTATYFAWTIQHPLTPVYMGASYITAGFGLFLSLLSNRWSVARTIMPAIVVFALSQFFATMLHISLFHWERPIAWAWLAVYVLAAPAGAAIYFRTERRFQLPEPRDARAGCVLQPVMIAFAAIYALIGVALVFLPGLAGPAWPWSLTLLTARVVGGWLLTVATLAWALARQRALDTAWAILLANLCLSFFVVAGVLWRRADLDGPAISAVIFFAVFGLLGGFSGVYLLSRIVARPAAQSAASTSSAAS
jgi:hypothetical protein